jgi:hypothetical protein
VAMCQGWLGLTLLAAGQVEEAVEHLSAADKAFSGQPTSHLMTLGPETPALLTQVQQALAGTS